MNRDHKIEKINAYRKMLSTSKVPQAKDDDVLSSEINSEFQAWATVQLSALLGEGTVSKTDSVFSDEDLEILQALISGVKAKRQQTTTVSEETQPRPSQIRPAPRPTQSLPEAERSRLNANAQPLGNKRMGNSNSSSANDPLLSKLEQMDRDGPEY